MSTPAVYYFPPGYYGPNLSLPVAPTAGPATAGYTHTTFGTAKDLLAKRLGDPDKVFWVDAELGRYIKDALRHWSLLAQYYKDKATFDTDVGQPFYLLTEQVPALRQYTVTEQELIESIQDHLMEPVDGTQWLGSEQFNYELLLNSINRIRDHLLVETGLNLQAESILTDSPPVAKINLADDIIDIRRVAWQDTSNNFHILKQGEHLARNFFNPRASFNPSTPEAFITVGLPLVSLELTPPSNDVGTLHMISTRSGETVDGTGILLGIPDDFVPTLKWGVLADLLNSERASDPDRAAYCEARWQEGLENCKVSPSVWAMEINGQQIATCSLEEQDKFNPNWQNSADQPTSVAAAGLDLIALSPIPDDVYSVTVTTTRKAIVPSVDGDYIQIGREYIDVLLDYCTHLATFKQGGETFLSTKPQLEGFIAAAQGRNPRLRAQAFYLDSATAQSIRERLRRPVEVVS